MVFFEEHLSAAERGRIEPGATLVGGADVRVVPATNVRPDPYAVTRSDLAPRDGVLLADTYRQPRPTVTRVSNGIGVETPGVTETVAAGTERTIELPSREGQTSRVEPTESKTANDPGEPAEPTGYAERTGRARRTPRLVVRNRGRVTARRVPTRTGGD